MKKATVGKEYHDFTATEDIIILPVDKETGLLYKRGCFEKFREYFINRKIFIAREMTKVYESSIRDEVKSVRDFPTSLKGELTVILSKESNIKNIKKEIPEAVKLEIKRMLKKYSHKDVVEFISKKENLSKKKVYNFCLKYNG